MANIRENKKNGKIISYRFTVCLERDAQGKQVRKYTTWTPPEELTPAKAKKAAERAAESWEETAKAEYQQEKYAAEQKQTWARRITKTTARASVEIFARAIYLWDDKRAILPNGGGKAIEIGDVLP